MKPLPSHLPPLPTGAVYLGLGGTFSFSYFDGWAIQTDTDHRNTWEKRIWAGTSPSTHYAVLAHSEIAKANATVEPQSVHIVWSASRQEPTKTHPSRESAVAEAKRLCAKHPAHEFFVFERVAGFKGTVTVESI